MNKAQIYCINPNCSKHTNPIEKNPVSACREIYNNPTCPKCGTNLIIHDYYSLGKLLYQGKYGLIEIWKTIYWEPAITSFSSKIDDPGGNKVIKMLHSDDKTLQDLFIQEADMLADLNRKKLRLGIPKVKNGWRANFPYLDTVKQTTKFFLMEEIEGINLENYLVEEKEGVEESLATEWLKQLAFILQEIHQEGVTHRDVNPSNIMLNNKDDTLVLIDFGIALRGTPDNKKLGTVFYKPPEQEKGKAELKSDFFALGRTFVCLLMGKLPEENPNLLEYWQDFSKTNVSKWLVDLINDLMAPFPKNRPSLEEILERLELKDEWGKAEEPEEGKSNFPSTTKKSRMLLYLIAIAFVAFCWFPVPLLISEILNMLGVYFYKNNQQKSAWIALNMAIKFNSENSSARNTKNMILQDFLIEEVPLEQSEKLGRHLNPGDCNKRARDYNLEGEHEKAKRLVRNCRSLAKSTEAKYAMNKNEGWALLGEGKYDEAEAILTDATNLIKNRADAHCLLAQALEGKGDRTSALEHWDGCLRFPSERLSEHDKWSDIARERFPNKEN